MPRLAREVVAELISSIRDQTYSVAARKAAEYLVDLHQYPHEDAYIYQHLREAFDDIFDKAISWTTGESRLRSPHVKEGRIAGSRITVTVTHRGTAEEVYGVDLIYEIDGKKVIGFQHKKADENHDFRVDTAQLQKIIRICPTCQGSSLVPHPLRGATGTDVFVLRRQSTEGYIASNCSSLYVMTSPTVGKQGALSACKVVEFQQAYRRNRNEMHKLMTRDAVDESSVKCVLGYDLQLEAEGRGILENVYDTLFADSDLIFAVVHSRDDTQTVNLIFKP